MARGLGHQQIWVVEHLRTVGLVPAPTNRSIASARFGANTTKGQAELIRQALHRLHRDGIITVERRGRDLVVIWLDWDIDVRAPSALKHRAEVRPVVPGEFARRMRSRRGRQP